MTTKDQAFSSKCYSGRPGVFSYRVCVGMIHLLRKDVALLTDLFSFEFTLQM
jgi:hypothetical protein